ncbi:hypothetical protein AOA73_18190 [Pseudomonas aeruginosa]|nr:hypothetical protein [Pseudomonas aeruginosa]KPE31635.1 hypothetical protein AOA73_18190 [Pseudomonas aeruginosa]RIY99519.1 hypothetical protein AXW97_22455 [Pseudomonas aeruginosa]
MILLYSAMKWSKASLSRQVDISSGGDKNAYGFAVTPAADDMQRRVAPAISIVNGVNLVLEEVGHCRNFREDILE